MVDRMEVNIYPLCLISPNIVSVGLLVAACVNRAPEGTFGAAIAEVGVLDLLKACFVPKHLQMIALTLLPVFQLHYRYLVSKA